MSEEQIEALESWDPDEAKARIDATRMKMPVTFKRDDLEIPNMQMECDAPREARTERTAPQIVDISKNKNKLF